MIYKRNLKLSAEKEGLFHDPVGGASNEKHLIRCAHSDFYFHTSSLRRAWLGCLKTKIPTCVGMFFIWRRKRDSNPRIRGYRSTVFKTAAFDRSAISPLKLKTTAFAAASNPQSGTISPPQR